MILTANGMNNGQSQACRTLFLLGTLIKTFEDTLFIQSLIASRILEAETFRSNFNSDDTFIYIMYKCILQQIGH